MITAHDQPAAKKMLFIIIPYIEYFYFHSTCIIGIN